MQRLLEYQVASMGDENSRISLKRGESPTMPRKVDALNERERIQTAMVGSFGPRFKLEHPWIVWNGQIKRIIFLLTRMDCPCKERPSRRGLRSNRVSRRRRGSTESHNVPYWRPSRQKLLADACMWSRSLERVMSAGVSVDQVRTWPQPGVRGSCAHTIKGGEESGRGELEPDRSQKVVPGMAGLHHDARRRTAVMSVNSDAVGDQSSQAFVRSSHHVVCRLMAAWPHGRMAARPGYEVPGGLVASPWPPAAAAFWAKD